MLSLQVLQPSSNEYWRLINVNVNIQKELQTHCPLTIDTETFVADMRLHTYERSLVLNTGTASVL